VTAVTPRVLVAGIGNIFQSDDGFGPEVARRLVGLPVPAGVEVADFGIRGVHLAYELLDGYDVAILVDALPGSEPAGTISVLEPAVSANGEPGHPGPAMDAHDLAPDSVLRLLGDLGGQIGKVLVVGCQPADAGEGIGLSPPVAAAVDTAIGVVLELITQEVSAHTGKGEEP
jgi:hydrogenase maturation protease